MSDQILITGGAGFIGSHLADRLIAGGRRVRVLDTLVEQVHGRDPVWPDYLNPEVETLRGDIRDPDAVRKALRGVDAVVHLAAAVGVEQSMSQIAHYTAVNNLGTAVLLEALAEAPVRRLVVASSMSIYGEGLYADADGNVSEPLPRSRDQLDARRWECTDARGQALEPRPTPEDKPAAPASVYALSKLDQERLCLMLGEAGGTPAVALRFFNVYGPRQSLANPYTGVLAIFAARILNGERPVVFEDGEQRRDFVDVRDIAHACELALDRDQAVGQALNVGSGESHSIREVAARLATLLGRPDLAPEFPGRYRSGDIRHCYADTGRARDLLGFAPAHALDTGLAHLTDWLEDTATPGAERPAIRASLSS